MIIKELEEKLSHKEQECAELKSVRDMWMSKCEQEMKTSEFFQDVLAEVKAENDKLKQTLTEIKEIAEPYRMTINKICGNCKKYDSCHACCYKDINCYKYTSSKTNACEEFTYLDKLIPNILAKQILQKIREVENNNDG